MIDLQNTLSHRQRKTPQVFFIAIDGRAGSGKSSLATWLGKALHAEIIQVDDFSGPDNPFAWAGDMQKHVIQPILAGKKYLSYPRASWWENHAPPPVENQPVTDVMIIEGVGSVGSAINSSWDLTLYVETPRPICFRRGVERDLSTGKPRRDIETIWRHWQEKETAYLAQENPIAKVDFVLNGTLAFADQIVL